MRFSEHFGIAPTLSDDWFDPLLNQDTPLYVDPFLVFDDEDPLWTGARAEVIRFFETVLLRILKSDGIRGSASWNQAAGLLRCPEPNEFALGLSVGDPRGAGVGSQTAERIATVLDLLRSAGATELSSISGFSIFVDGMGPDLISDALCNILMSRFITYTQRVARSSGLPTQPIRVRNAAFDHAHERWLTKTVELPHNPFQNSAVLLTPKRFLQDLPPPDLTDFWDWGDSLGEELRQSLNVLAADDLSASQKIAGSSYLRVGS